MDGVAYLSNVNDISSFTFDNKVIRFKGPYSLDKFSSIVEWDNGYLVVVAKYSHAEDNIEDYIDLAPNDGGGNYIKYLFG